uniref:Uncharacterized protein n=1 Tax=Mastacembelus armatus TaxID=205130 RepID=A0A7N9B0R9_9TELE
MAKIKTLLWGAGSTECGISQGNNLRPDGPAEQALIYHQMMEGLTLSDKFSKTHTHMQTMLPSFAVHLKVPADMVMASSLADAIIFLNIASPFCFRLLKDRPTSKASWPPHCLTCLQGYDVLKDL